MKRSYIPFISLLLLSTSGMRADMLSPVGNFFNILVGGSYHVLAKILWGYSDDHLKPENEKFAQDIAQKMGIKQTIWFYKAPKNNWGPHCLGNRIYLDESEFEEFTNQPDTLRFVIGHELVHADSYHGLKTYLMWLAINYGITKVIYTDGRLKERTDQVLSSLPMYQKLPHSFQDYPSWLLLEGIAAYLSYKMVAPLSRIFERESDTEAQRRLTSFYGKEKLAQGFVAYGSRWSNKPYSWYEKLFASHPHPRERYTYLGITKKQAKPAFDVFLRELKKRVILTTVCIYNRSVAEASGEQGTQNTLLDATRSKNRVALKYNAVLCSFDTNVAQKALDELEGDAWGQVLSQTIEYLKTGAYGDLFTDEEKNLLDQRLNTSQILTVDHWSTIKNKTVHRLKNFFTHSLIPRLKGQA